MEIKCIISGLKRHPNDTQEIMRFAAGIITITDIFRINQSKYLILGIGDVALVYFNSFMNDKVLINY